MSPKKKRKRREAFITTTRTVEVACPVCHRRLDAATGVGFDAPPVPEPGDVTQCVYCGALLTFTEAMQLRLATEAEWNQIPPELQRVLRGMHPKKDA